MPNIIVLNFPDRMNTTATAKTLSIDQTTQTDPLELPPYKPPRENKSLEPVEDAENNDDNNDDEYDLYENYNEKIHVASDFTENERWQICCLTVRQMERNLQHYTGIPTQLSCVLKLINEKSGVSIPKILLVLRKIRHNESFQILGDLFGLARQHAGMIFLVDLEKIANSLRSFIYPSQQSSTALSTHKYIILQCFEMTIAKPTQALQDVLSWSGCSETAKVKFLIGCTRNGVIVFISEGFFGKIPDSEVVRQCGFMDFTKTDTFGDCPGCKSEIYLKASSVRPADNATDEAKMSKNIAAIRISMMNAIKNLRKFAYLQQHSSVLHYKRSVLFEHTIAIASAICNMMKK